MKLFRPHPKISAAGAPHAAELRALLEAAWSGCPLNSELLEATVPSVEEVDCWFRGGFEVFRASFADELVGMVRCCFPSGATVVDRLAVAPQARLRGVGRALLDHAASRARRAGSGKVWATAPAAAGGLIECHRSAGFRDVARHAYHPWKTELALLELRL